MSGLAPNPAAPVITIDGPSGVGKGTLCRMLANYLGWHLLDSGALYRILALSALRQHWQSDDARLLALAEDMDLRFQDKMVLLAGEDVSAHIRQEEVGSMASQLAAIPYIRQALLARQQAFQQLPGLAADGRDMGTVVFPNAVFKIFLTASVEERAKRREKQLREQGLSANLSRLRMDIESRDLRDSTRAVAPLRPADDAQVLDTSGLGIEASFAAILAMPQMASWVG